MPEIGAMVYKLHGYHRTGRIAGYTGFNTVVVEWRDEPEVTEEVYGVTVNVVRR